MEAQINITLPEVISAQPHNAMKLRRQAVKGLLLVNYMEGALSKMEVAEALGLNRDEIDALLLKYNMPTIMNLPKETREATARNRENLAKRLGMKTSE